MFYCCTSTNLNVSIGICLDMILLLTLKYRCDANDHLEFVPKAYLQVLLLCVVYIIVYRTVWKWCVGTWWINIVAAKTYMKPSDLLIVAHTKLYSIKEHILNVEWLLNDISLSSCLYSRYVVIHKWINVVTNVVYSALWMNTCNLAKYVHITLVEWY